MNHSAQLAPLRRKFRTAIKGLREEEPVDLVFLASVLCNFAPARMTPHWLVVVSSVGAGTTRLIETIQPWTRFVVTMVTAMTPGFCFSTKGGKRVSPLQRLHEEGKRILLSRAATSFTDVDSNTAAPLYAQLREVHDGFLYRETGKSESPCIYNPLPEERLGWIVASNTSWYTFQKRNPELGSRFGVYYYDGFEEWTNVRDLLALDESVGSDDAKIRRELSMDVIAYLTAAMRNIDEWLPKVMYERHHSDRIAAAVKLVMRANSEGDRSGDTGKRLFMRARELAKMLAFMHGRTLVSSLDTDVVLRYVFSQMLPDYQKFFQLYVRNSGEPLMFRDLVADGSCTKRTWELRLKALMELGIVTRSNTKGFSDGYKYTLSDEAHGLVRAIGLQVPEPPAKIVTAQEAVDELIATEVEKRGLVV